VEKITRAIDRFCYKHPGFGIRNLMLYIVIANAAVFLFCQMDTTGRFLSYLYFDMGAVLRGQVWRLVTFLFIPTSGSLLWEAVALYFYYFIGSTLEAHWGTAKFNLFYLCGTVFTMLYSVVLGFFINGSMPIDATYLNLSLFFAFATLFPETRVLLFFFIPVKIKWLAYLDAALFAFAIVTNPFPINLLPLIAILNFFLFCGGYLLRTARSGRMYNKQSVNFRRESTRAIHERESLPYRHKCSVCGKTDTDFPGMEFRYCSRCEGYHCFCSDHINNHVHFTE